MTHLKPIIVPAGVGRTLQAFGDEIQIHLDGSQTGGTFAVFTDTTPPGGGPPPHLHEKEDEWWEILEGEAEFLIEGSWRRVKKGDRVFAPRNAIHTFRNVGTTPLKQLIHVSPAGFETFFERCAAVFAQPGPPDMKRIVEISTEHGIHYFNP